VTAVEPASGIAGRRPLLVLAAVTAVVVAAIWLLPPVGFVAACGLLLVVPPWGRSLAERGVISLVVVAGLVALVFPRAGTTPVTPQSARLALSALIIAVLLLRLVPRLRQVRIPRPTLADGIVLLLAAGAAFWLMAAYIGRDSYQLVSGLYFSGWDNQGHFTTFANTYKVGSTTWPTVDGSVAWNQWYPSLHTTIWALAELASRSASTLLDRPGLLWPYVQWNAITFALCLAVLAWVAGDLAARVAGAGGRVARWARPVAVAAFAVFALLGSPAYLYNLGFTNFVMGVTITVAVSYLCARSWRSARTLGWFLLPLGALAVVGLWTPLALGLIPAGVVVAVALLRTRWWIGAAWLGAAAVAGAFMLLTQMSAILGVEPGQSAGDFTQSLGAVGAGMAPFNLGAGLAAPVIVVLGAVVLIRQRRPLLAVTVLGPVLGAGVIALVFASGADAAAIGRLESYYVLKSIDAMLLSVAPLLAALAAVALVRALVGLDRVTAVVATATAAVALVASFGYVFARPDRVSSDFAAAPGIQAGWDRMEGIDDWLVGSAIIRARDAAVPYPGYTTLLWDGAGTLPNLWVSSLSGVMSKTQNTFYKGLPSFPYDEKTAQYVTLALNLDADMRVAVLWFRDPSGQLVNAYVAKRGDGRVVSVKVPMPSSPLCEECHL
jgi:hypothetical protein